MLLDQIKKDCLSNDCSQEHCSSLSYSSGLDCTAFMQADSIDDFIFAAGNGTKQSPYCIETEEQLRAFARSLNQSVDYKNIYIQLTDNIRLSEKDWIPIGEGEYAFRGHFDGHDYTISGLRIGSDRVPHVDKVGKEATGYFAFFGVLDTGASVSNLNLDVSFHIMAGQTVYVAGLTGYAQEASIENVHVSGIVSGATYHDEANVFVGGICANGYKQDISYCSSSAEIKTEAIGGMAEAGGIIGFHNRGLVNGCHASGNISAVCEPILNGRPVLGGIVGVHAGTVNDCYSTAIVQSDYYSGYIGALAGWATGISVIQESFYCLDACQKQGQTMPTSPAGMRVERGQNTFGETFSGCLITNVYGFDAETLYQKAASYKLKSAM